MGARGPKPGKIKTGGRKKGTPNKLTLELVKILESAGFDPAAKLIELTLKAEESYERHKNGESGPGYLATASKNCTEIMRFVYPTRKAVDVTSGGEKVFQNFSELLASIPNDARTNPSDKK